MNLTRIKLNPKFRTVIAVTVALVGMAAWRTTKPARHHRPTIPPPAVATRASVVTGEESPALLPPQELNAIGLSVESAYRASSNLSLVEDRPLNSGIELSAATPRQDDSATALPDLKPSNFKFK